MTKREAGMTAAIEMTTAIEAARDVIGTPPRVESLRAKLATALVATAGTGATSSETAPAFDTGSLPTDSGAILTAPSSGGISVAKIVLLAAALGVVGAASWVAKKGAEQGQPGLRSQIPASAPSVARPPESPPANQGGAKVQVFDELQRSTAQSESDSTGSRDFRRGLAVGSATSAQRLRAGGSNDATESMRIAATKDRARSGMARAASPADARGASREAAPPSARSQVSEVELLTRAQVLVDSQPSAALDVLHEHERVYPAGLLREERDVLRIDAEWALGRRETALVHARSFVQRYPRSTQARRFETLLSDHKNETDSTPTE
jgi:hypothetical protein